MWIVNEGGKMERYTAEITQDWGYSEYGECGVDVIAMVLDKSGEYVRYTDVLELLQKYGIDVKDI